MKTSLKIISLISVGSLLGACATTSAPSASFGKSVQHNTAVHAVAPTDVQKQNTFIPADRDRKALAKERYKKDEVEEPTPVNTMN